MEFNPATRKAITLVVLVFALGVAFGAVSTSLVNRRVYGARTRTQNGEPRPGRERLVKRLKGDLDLSAEQEAQLTGILANTQSRYDAVHEQMKPQFDQIREQGRDQIRQILTPEQRPKFEEFMRQVDEEHHRKVTH